MAIPDVIVYFGPLEFAAVVLGIVLATAVALIFRHRARNVAALRRLLDGFPYPAMLFRRSRLALKNVNSVDLEESRELMTVVSESWRKGEKVVRTVPAVEGQSYQVRAIPLTSEETLLLLEDLAAAQRQQAFYRNFIQNVSHELKTPLTVIQGHAAKIGDAPSDREGWIASIRIISEEAKRLTQLVDNLLTLARLESPSFHLDLAPTNLGALLEESILQMSELAEKRQIAISLNLASGLPRVQADQARLKQVVLNLLDNALKYTPPGGEVTVNLKADPEAKRLVCSIHDTGEGIPEEDLPYIFDKLYRARRAKGRPVEGSGLGLTIVQQIIRAHGGEIEAQSELGAGSTFTFKLPHG